MLRINYVTELLALTGLEYTQLLFLTGVVFIAGIVRGFSGFALSALIMASLATILPPFEILPMNFILEAAAGLMMVRGGIKDADMRVVIGLVVASAIGMPIGLTLTTTAPLELTRIFALSTILILAILLFANIHPRNPERATILYSAGLLSGLVTGIAGVGGMVVVIYVFSLGRRARVIRASLVMYLFLSLVMSLFYYVYFDLMTEIVIWRGATLAIPTIIGVMIGSRLFSNAHEKFYRIFCLGLLIFLATTGLLRVIL